MTDVKVMSVTFSERSRDRMSHVSDVPRLTMTTSHTPLGTQRHVEVIGIHAGSHKVRVGLTSVAIESQIKSGIVCWL